MALCKRCEEETKKIERCERCGEEIVSWDQYEHALFSHIHAELFNSGGSVDRRQLLNTLCLFEDWRIAERILNKFIDNGVLVQQNSFVSLPPS